VYVRNIFFLLSYTNVGTNEKQPFLAVHQLISSKYPRKKLGLSATLRGRLMGGVNCLPIVMNSRCLEHLVCKKKNGHVTNSVELVELVCK